MNTGKTFQISSCEVCGNEKLHTVLNLGYHPMCDDLVPLGDDRVCKEYPIEILYCDTCFTSHQKYQIPKSDLFPKSYHYRARFTADVLMGMKSLVDRCEALYGILQNKKVVDIGCNDGSLLDFFKEKGAITLGVEPTGAAKDAQEKGHIVFDTFISMEVAKKIVDSYGRPDFITFTNVFAHIENLDEVIETLNYLSDEHTTFVIENHYLGSILATNQFDTFYHEHPRTYSLASFRFIAASLNKKLSNVEFPSRYGGNIRVFIGKSDLQNADVNVKEIDEREKTFHNKFEIMDINIQKWIRAKRTEILEYVEKYGPIKAKAFPGRAAILIKLLNLDENQIISVFEKPGSMKIGNYIPGTRIPILSDDVLFEDLHNTPVILNLAWHISTEIRNYFSARGYEGIIFDILDKNDFE